MAEMWACMPCKDWYKTFKRAAAGKQAGSHAEDSDDEGDLVWQGITSSEAAQPTTSTAAANGDSAAHAISLAAAKSGRPHPHPAEALGDEVSASNAAGTEAPVVMDGSRAGQDKPQNKANLQRSQKKENSRTKAPGWSWSLCSSQLLNYAVHSKSENRPMPSVLTSVC